MSLQLRPATRDDVALIRHLIHALAVYEKAEDQVAVSEEDLLRDGFGERPVFRCTIAEWAGEGVGFALFFYNYSTWQGRAGLYLEDLFVLPEHRGKGIGKALLRDVARIGAEEGCGRMQWACLDWNTPAVEFYESLGAVATKEWWPFRVEGTDAIRRLAETGCATPTNASQTNASQTNNAGEA